MITVVSGMKYVAVTYPVVQIIYGSTPAFEFEVTERIGAGAVMRTVYIHSVAENSRFAVGNVFPKRKIWIHSSPQLDADTIKSFTS